MENDKDAASMRVRENKGASLEKGAAHKKRLEEESQIKIEKELGRGARNGGQASCISDASPGTVSREERFCGNQGGW